MDFTIKDIAKLANVSYSTVSKALNDYGDVNENTKRKILEICENVGYTPNSIARELVKKSTKTLGFIVNDIRNPFFAEIALGIENEASRNGYHMFLCNTNWNKDNEKEYLETLLEKRVSGIIITPVTKETLLYAKSYAKKAPIVMLASDVVDDTSYGFALTDNYLCGYMAADYMLSLGHRRIAMVGGNRNACNYTGRFNGYKAALEEYGMETKFEFVRSCEEERLGYSEEDGFYLMNKLLEGSEKPTAVVALNDLCALGVIKAAEDSGYSVPDDISVIGCDDIPVAAQPKIGLTTLRQPKLELGQAACKLILELIGDGGISNTKVVYEPKLIIRDTTREIKI